MLDAYSPAARLFLSERQGSNGLGLERMSAADVSSYLARECPKRSVSGARDLVGALRSLLPVRATATESRPLTQTVVITPAEPAD